MSSAFMESSFHTDTLAGKTPYNKPWQSSSISYGSS